MFPLSQCFLLCSLDCSCFVLLWINGLKSIDIIEDKIFNKEIQAKMLPHVIVFHVCQAYYCLFVYGDFHRNRSLCFLTVLV